MPEGLVAAISVRVVVGVSLKVEQDEIRGQVIGVPGMVRLATLISPVGLFSPQQPVVLDVIGAGQLPPGEGGLDQQERHNLEAENDQ